MTAPKPKRVVYRQVYDGDEFIIERHKIQRWACCDCALVHDMAFVPSKDRRIIGVAVRVNKRATAGKRRGARAMQKIKQLARRMK